MEFRHSPFSLISNSESHAVALSLRSYLERLRLIEQDEKYATLESSLRLPQDTEILRKCQELVKQLAGLGLKYVVILGVGGSNLGAKAIYDAIYGNFDALQTRRYPRAIFLESLSGAYFEKALQTIHAQVRHPAELLVVVVSKSGATLETMAQAEVLYDQLRVSFPAIRERIVVVTDKDSPLARVAGDTGMHTLLIPRKVGGRFSVFSAAGLFPLSALGHDISALTNGAASALRSGLGENCLESAPVLLATLLYAHYGRGSRIFNMFLFNPELASLGAWCRQLIAESLGKEENIYGKQINAGLIPLVSLGSADLHSMAQLYLGGPRQMFTLFLKDKHLGDIKIGGKLFPGAVYSGHTTSEIDQATYEATLDAYTRAKLPFAEIKLSDLSEKSLGKFMQSMMLTVMLLGKLLRVNAFDQPAVEGYKLKTRSILEKG